MTRTISCLSAVCFALLTIGSCARAEKPVIAVRTPQQAEDRKRAIVPMDKPFLFAYGTWEKKVHVENGLAILSGDGVTPRGGAGANVTLDLTGDSDFCPAIKVKIGASNKMLAIRLILLDASGQSGTWEFQLPKEPGNFAIVTPNSGASLAQPDSLEKSDRLLDLKHILQWQLAGDWSSDLPLDAEVQSLLAVAPDAAAKLKREARAKSATDAKEKLRLEHVALIAKYGKRTPASPAIESVSLVAPDILALTIRSGKVIPGSLTKYIPETGDVKQSKPNSVLLVRGGQEIGWLIGAKRDTLVSYEKFEGDPLLDFVADTPETYTIRSTDDPNYATSLRPVAVYRKSKPTDWAQPARGFVMRHIVYIKSPKPFVSGRNYTIGVGDLNLHTSEIAFHCLPVNTRSEAIHVNQIGYRADDPAKNAFLSIWLGSGGACRYPADLQFHLLDDAAGKSVFTGKVMLAKADDEPEAMWKSQNFNKTSVYRMTFSDFQTPGTYRVYVEGIGCSYPFMIGANVWEHALQTQMRGLYNQRSGIELGPPDTTFRRPRDLFPADGQKVYQSTHSVLDESGESGEALEKGNMGVPVPQAWGGYHDAGDWNPRRVTHMKVTMRQLELMTLFPAYFRTLKLSIPSTQGVPDMLTEALFEIDCFRRLQKPDGGVPFGIETNGDPYDGEVSWNQSMTEYVWSPDLWSSYYYAEVAACAARVLAPYDAKRAAIYRESAVKAARWGESEYAKRRANGTLAKLRWEAKDDRNYAALQLYITTGDKRWHDIFLENTCLTDPRASVFAWGDHVQRDAAFEYAHLSDKFADPAIKANARRQVLLEAEKSLTYASGNAFNLTTPDKGKPMFLGFYSTPDAIELARAHYLTREAKYLSGAVQACQFSAGDNPSNMTYTTGLGSNSPQHVLNLDARHTGQPTPVGLTPYGNIDYSQWHDNFTTWPITYYLDAICKPSPYEWPTSEAYFDIYLYPAVTEFTVDLWAPNVFVWGYLAARK